MKNDLNPQENKLNEIKSENIKYDFPKGTLYEKELMTNFKYFNIFWYDPNKTNDFDFFKNCFINVRLVKGTNIESAIDFFKKEIFSDEWIVITPGSKGEEFIKNLEQNQCIYCFFVYCKNIEEHEKWTKNIPKVKYVTSNPEILCKELIELNKDYLFPNFNYGQNITKEKNNEDHLFSWNLKKLTSENEFALNSVKREIKVIVNTINKTKNLYSKFCIKSINYLNSEKCLKDYKEPIPNESSFHYFAHRLREESDEDIKSVLKVPKEDILLSLYFNEYEYIMNLISYEEIKEIYNNVISNHNYENKSLNIIREKLIEKLMKNESIIELKEELKEIQKFFIFFIFKFEDDLDKKECIDIYEISNALRDFGFCSKMYVFEYARFLNNKNYNFYEDLMSSIMFDDMFWNFSTNPFKKRKNESFDDFEFDVSKNKEESSKELIKEKLIKINNLLSKKNFIIIGDKNFNEKIKSIEKDLKIETIEYLQINDISYYIKEKNKNDHKKNKIRTFFYYLIITYNKFQKYFEKIILLSAELGITFLILIYIEKDNLLIPKSYIRDCKLISIVYVYSTEDILRYFKNGLKLISFNGFTYTINCLKSLNLIKSNNQNIFTTKTEEDYQDGCFELAETFNYNIVKNKTLLNWIYGINPFLIDINIYEIYKEHNALDLFFNQIIKHFRFCLKKDYIEILDVCYIKMILYLYCREEKEHEKSFYRMINDDLRTKDPNKIDRIIVLLGLINKLIENNELASFKGKVYRATKLDENLILQLKEGSKMINTTFWSTSKNIKIAENFMKKNKWRNAFIICDAIKTNIDIDYEKLNPYNEYEVLILPFTEFKVEKIYSENKYGKKIYIIELIELGNKNFVSFKNMNNEYINMWTFFKNCINQFEKALTKEFKNE